MEYARQLNQRQAVITGRYLFALGQYLAHMEVNIKMGTDDSKGIAEFAGK